MIDRILAVIKEKNLTPSQFADEIGIQRSGMSHLISGRNNPSLEFILKILKRFPDIDPVWLLLGEDRAQQEKAPTEIAESALLENLKELQSEKKPETVKETKGGEKKESLIEKIVILYRDNSFKEYHPK